MPYSVSSRSEVCGSNGRNPCGTWKERLLVSGSKQSRLPYLRDLQHLQAGHAWLSQHYRWGLNRLFKEEGHTHAIVLEDDMLFSPDFLEMFEVKFQDPVRSHSLVQCLLGSDV